MTVRCRAAGRSPSRTAPSASSTPRTRAPDSRSVANHPIGSPVQCRQLRWRKVLPRASASGTQGNGGTARQAPTASQVRSRVPRFAPCNGHRGAAIKCPQQRCGRRRRLRRSSLRLRRSALPLMNSRRTAPMWTDGSCSSSACFAAHAGHRRFRCVGYGPDQWRIDEIFPPRKVQSRMRE